MFIELIGPPGSGKTTIAALLDEHLSRTTVNYISSGDLTRLDCELGDHHIKRIGLARRVISLAPLLWHHPRVAAIVLALAALHGPNRRERYRRARRLLAHFLLLLRLRQRAENSVIILDDGFVQRLWSMLIESTDLRATSMIKVVLDRYHATLRPVCVSLEIDDSAATTRVFNRESRGRFNQSTNEMRRRDFARWLDYHRRLVALLPPGAIVDSVDANGTPSEVAQRLTTIVICLAERQHAA